MILFTLIALLQAFCYGAEETANPLETIITEDGVCPFVHSRLQKLQKHFSYLISNPVPDRNAVKNLVAWSQRYLLKNKVYIPAEQIDAVDEALKQAFKTRSLKELGSDLDREKYLRGKVFVIPGDQIHSMYRLAASIASADLIFVASNDRVLTYLDFTSLDLVDGNDESEAVIAIRKKQEEREQNQKKPLTEYDGAVDLSESMKAVFGTKVRVIKNTKSLHAGAENPAYLGESFEGNMIALKKFCDEHHDVHFDGVLCAFPHGLDQKKRADQIFKMSIPFYDGYAGVLSNRVFIKCLASALHIEAEEKGFLPDHPLETIITEDGVNLFVWKCFQRFQEDYGLSVLGKPCIDPVPDRKKVKELVDWSQRYFFKPSVLFPDGNIRTVDEALKEAFQMRSLDEFGSTRGKVFVISGCLVRSMHRLASNAGTAELIFVASDDRVLTYLDFTPLDPVGGNDEAVLSIQRKQAERKQNKQKLLTEFEAAQCLASYCVGARVVKNAKSLHAGANAAYLGASFEGNMIVFKKFCDDQAVHFDGVLCAHPHGVDKKKRADQIFERSIPFYDVYTGVLSNEVFLNRLAAAFYIEAEVKGYLSENPLDTIITKDGVNLFVWQCFKKFQREAGLNDCGRPEVDPVPERNKVQEFVDWSQRYFGENRAHVPYPISAVDEDLKQSFQMKSLAVFGSTRDKVFVISGCHLNLMNCLSKNAGTAELIYVASDDRVVTNQDFTPLDSAGNGKAVLAIQREQEERKQKKQTLLTEFKATQRLAYLKLTAICQQAQVVKNTKSLHEGAANAEYLGKSFEGNMIALKNYCDAKNIKFDAVLCAYPHGFAMKKTADQIFGRSIPFCDVCKDVLSNRVFLNSLASALDAEAAVAAVKGCPPEKPSSLKLEEPEWIKKSY